MEEKEMMELESAETEETGLSVMDDYTEDSGSGKALGLVLAGLAGVAAVGAVAYKKIKDKKSGKPRKKKKLMWVEVEDEPDEVDEADVIDSDAEVVEETENK